MKTPTRPTLAIAALVIGSLTGCGLAGGGDGNGSGNADGTDANVDVRFTSSTNRRSTHLTVTKLDVWVDEVVFDAETDSNSISVSETQQVKVDALTGTASSDPVRVALTEGTYFSPYLGVEIWDSGAEPALVLEGTLDSVPIRFVFNSAEVFEAESERLHVAEGETYTVDFTLQPDRWFEGVDGTSLTTGDDGVALISDSSNAEIFDTIADLLDETTDGRFPGGTNGDTGEPPDTGDSGDVD